ncbi:post-GPI attachment to proteins factor 2 [Phlebotomus papatasi]|uniref:post-GPI attachment to proteins factor 2 n=1 Tax=Phlebotomus papatasi TaxID=29031 RepID=UPI0024842C69|nr:post-GPI attachment to proteins factor 2 [Phlebotomus papatasi]
MLPEYHSLDRETPLFRTPFGKFAFRVVSLPFFSFLFCVLWSVVFYFDRATATHCHVYNFLPSISAAIGSYQPQRFIWQVAICAHAVPRFMVAYMYLRYYRSCVRKRWHFLVNSATMLNVVENGALLGLSLFTSVDSYEIHKFCFITFIATSELYMLVSYIMNINLRRGDSLTKLEDKSIRFKGYLCLINIVSFSLAGYFFLRHNSYCEPGVYSLFALFEYIVVLTNMGFHMTAYWDFHGRWISFSWTTGLYFSQN